MTLTVDIAEVTEGLQADLDAVASERGRPITLDELTRMVTRHRAVRRAWQGDGEEIDRDGALDRSVRVGDVTMRSQSLAGRMMVRRLLRWNAEDPTLFDQDAFDVLRVWIYAHNREADMLGQLVDVEAAAQIVEAFAHRLTAPLVEYVDAIDVLEGARYPDPDGGDRANPDEIDTARALTKYAGGTVRHWLYEVCESFAAHVMHAVNRALRRDAAESAKAAGKLPPPEFDPKVTAMSAYDTELDRLKADG